MIGFLRGTVAQVDLDHLLLDVNGVGYELFCSSTTLAEAAQAQGQLRLSVHTHVREDALTLFGFVTPFEKQVFLSLLKVNGVGPKMAMAILSATSVQMLAQMIEGGDVRGLTQLPKVGKKTAEQIVLSLRGKLVVDAGSVPLPLQRRADVVSALVNLGFRLADVEPVVENLPPEASLEESVRLGLRALSSL